MNLHFATLPGCYNNAGVHDNPVQCRGRVPGARNLGYCYDISQDSANATLLALPE